LWWEIRKEGRAGAVEKKHVAFLLPERRAASILFFFPNLLLPTTLPCQDIKCNLYIKDKRKKDQVPYLIPDLFMEDYLLIDHHQIVIPANEVAKKRNKAHQQNVYIEFSSLLACQQPP
jgi:hypothetical protein